MTPVKTVSADAASARLRLVPVLAPVTLAGAATVVAAVYALAANPPSPTEVTGIVALLAAATLAKAFPVPIELDGVAAGGVSLTAVFIVGSAILYGPAAAVVISFTALALIQVAKRGGWIRLAYDSAVYALCGAATGGAAALADPRASVGSLLVATLLASAAFYAVHASLLAAIVARSAARPILRLLARSLRFTAVPFSIMASLSLMLIVLWDRSPLLSAALVGPLVAVALYQRSVHDALSAMRLALTDPLTGLGNHRHFHERLQRDLDRAQVQGTSLSLCLVDIDDFKQINDRYGHPVGDRVLAEVATRLRHGGEAFRLGGDEFALLLPDQDEAEALAVAQSVVGRIASMTCDHGGHVTVSAVIATYPHHGLERSDLVRVADSALYWSKEHGKSRVLVYGPDVFELDELRRVAH